ncbi:MAG: acyltransferase family protein [Beijerinckiaceae bacterium]
MTPSRERYLVLDTWRYIAAAGVVLYHYENHFQPYLAAPSNYLHHFTYLVDFFFVLSGFVLMHTYGDSIADWRGYGRFMQKRFARLYPLHFVTTLAFVAVGVAAITFKIDMRDPSSFDPGLAAPTLTLLHAWGFTSHPGLNFPSWSISSEFFVYFLFPLFAFLLVRTRPLVFILAALAFATVMHSVRVNLGMRPWTEATFDYGMLRAVPSFMAGMAVYMIVSALPRMRVSWLWVHAVMAALFAAMLAQVHPFIVIACFPFAVGLIAMAERGGARTAMQSPLGAKLGDASYGIYMLHSMVQIASLVLVRKFHLTSVPELIAVALAGTLFATLLAIASYHWFEMPARKWLSKPLAIFAPRKQAGQGAAG